MIMTIDWSVALWQVQVVRLYQVSDYATTCTIMISYCVLFHVYIDMLMFRLHRDSKI